MRIIYFFIVLLFLQLIRLQAQEVDIQGKVTNSDEGVGLPGVSILIEGTTTGTITDMDGNFSLKVKPGSTVRFSYVGFRNQEILIGNQSFVSVQLIPDVARLQEVIVTSLGIERETKALGYSITEVEGDQITEARENNLSRQLQGRIAGVNVTGVSGGPASSTRVIIRGNKSLNGNNQPLYVVDGIPVDNWSYGQAGQWGGWDKGDGMTAINPDDIESIQVLKGANAAALYGSRAANGVINITTKKGKARKGIGLEFLSNFVIEDLYDQRDYQKEYGQGFFVLTDPLDPTSQRISVAPRSQAEAFNWNAYSWGPKLSSQDSSIQFDGVTRPYSYAGDNWDRFYQKGSTWTNTLTLTGGGEKQNFYFSASDLRNSDIIPNSGYNRQNLSLSINSVFAQKLTLQAKVLYSHEEANNRPRLSDSPGNAVLSMHYFPPNINVNDFKGDPEKQGAIPLDTPPVNLAIWGKSVGEELPFVGYNPWHQNPWWVAYQYSYEDMKDRIIASALLRYDLTNFLYVQGRIGMDWLTRRETNITPQGTGYDRAGSMNEFYQSNREINADYMIGYQDVFGPVSIDAFIGGNWRLRIGEGMNINGTGFNVPFFHAINNSVNKTPGYSYAEEGINSLFGQAEIGYDNFVFLTASARNDWFSVLNPEYNSILYPSVGLSLVFSDLIKALPSWLSFGKIRGSWGQVGNVTVAPYRTIRTYSILNNTHLGYPMASFSTARGAYGQIPNPTLQPLLSTELEFGIDMRFFNNRLGFDVTWYTQKAVDDILNAQISLSSGFSVTPMNLGEMTNTGIEVLVNGTPLTGAFTWDISMNFAKNTNEVVSITDQTDELIIDEPRNRNVYIKHIEGQPFGMITGRVQKKYNGQPVFFSDGRMDATDEYVIIGNGNPDWTGGLNNSLTYRNINLSFLIDFKIGGDIVSGTNMRMTAAGLHKQTLIGREDEPPITVSGVTQTSIDTGGNPVYEPIEMTLTPAQAQAYWESSQSDNDGIADMYVYDASFAKLRQLTLGYNFPQKLLNNTPIHSLSIAFVGRNLLVIWKNVENIDPESSYNNWNSQGLEYFAMPAVRSYGFSLRIGF
jgi:TonB-linked SusC/RagA family outer membrane protein